MSVESKDLWSRVLSLEPYISFLFLFFFVWKLIEYTWQSIGKWDRLNFERNYNSVGFCNKESSILTSTFVMFKDVCCIIKFLIEFYANDDRYCHEHKVQLIVFFLYNRNDIRMRARWKRQRQWLDYIKVSAWSCTYIRGQMLQTSRATFHFKIKGERTQLANGDCDSSPYSGEVYYIDGIQVQMIECSFSFFFFALLGGCYRFISCIKKTTYYTQGKLDQSFLRLA